MPPALSPIVQRAIAKDKGLPYDEPAPVTEPAPIVEQPQPDATPEHIQAVDQALQSFDAAKAPQVEAPVSADTSVSPAAESTPAAESEPGPVQLSTPKMPPPVSSEVKGNPADDVIARAIAKDNRALGRQGTVQVDASPSQPASTATAPAAPEEKAPIRTIEPRTGEKPPSGTSFGHVDAEIENTIKNDPRYKPWYDEFVKNNGGPPNLNDPDYDYQAAVKGGIVPKPYTDANGVTSYHWSSSLPDGQMLKSENHPTAWMEHFMRQTGKDPKDVGVHSMEEAFAYLGKNGPSQPPSSAPESAPLTLQPSLESARSDMAATTKEATDAAMRIGEANAQNATDRAERSKAFLEDFDKLEKEHGNVTDAAMAGYQRTLGEYRALTDKIAKMPPLADRRSGTAKALGGIALGLGQMTDQNNLVAGLMQGLNVQTHNADAIQAQLNHAVDRDLKIQQANLDSARATAQDKLTEVGLARQYLGDTQQAMRFAGALRKERYAAEVEHLAATHEAGTARDNALIGAAKIKADARKEMDDILQTEMGAKGAIYQALAAGKITAAEAAAALGGLSDGGANGPTAAEAKAANRASTVNKSQEQLAQGYHEAGAKLAPGLFVQDADSWNRKKTEVKQKELDTDFQSRELVRKMQSVRDYIAQNPDYATDINKRAAINAKRADILATYKDAKELGALDNGVERVVNRAVGDPTGWEDSLLSVAGKSPQALTTLSTSIEDANAAIASRRANNGLGNTAPEQTAEPEKTAKKPAAQSHGAHAPSQSSAKKPAVATSPKDFD